MLTDARDVAMNLSPAERKFFDALQAAARRRVLRDVPIA